MARVRLIHWKEAEVPERRERLRALGHDVEAPPIASGADLKALRADPPDAVVIDLARLPSRGREVAAALRIAKATRRVPLVFVAGRPDKVARVRALLPDATFTTWDDMASDLAAALSAPPTDPVVPADGLAGYAGTPLPRKLGIAAGATVALVAAPEGIDSLLGPLPDGATLREGPTEGAAITIWFVRSRAALAERIDAMAARLGTGTLWIAWPKKASRLAADLGQQDVRDAGLARGLVDSKIARIDETWAALRFTRRRS